MGFKSKEDILQEDNSKEVASRRADLKKQFEQREAQRQVEAGNLIRAAQNRLEEMKDKTKAAELEMRKACGSPEYAAKRDFYFNALEDYNNAEQAVKDRMAQEKMAKNNFKKGLDAAVRELNEDWDGQSPISAAGTSDVTQGDKPDWWDDTVSKLKDPEHSMISSRPEDKPGDNPEGKTKNKGKPEDKIVNSIANGAKSSLSDSFYRDLVAGIQGKRKGNPYDVAAANAATQARNLKNASGNRQMEAQASQQIANRNEFAEAGKIASMQNNAENKQTINNLSAAAGNSAALQRKTNTPDVQAMQSRQDSQRNVANERRTQADTLQRQATKSQGQVGVQELWSRDYDNMLNENGYLSNGGYAGSEGSETTEQTPDTEKRPETTPNSQEPAIPTGNPQHVINGLLGSPEGEDLRNGTATSDSELYNWAINQGVKPITPQSSNADDWEGEFLKANPDKGQTVMDQLRQWRAGEGNDKNTNFDASNADKMNQSVQVPSDENIKTIDGCLSDLRMKWIKEDYDAGEQISPEDFQFLLSRVGKFNHDGRDYDAYNEDDWSDDNDQSVLKAYADHIRNYLYSYKPEAVDIDSRIDPNEEHIGPMAQDIEQVNPACVKETPEGVKTVDTARLAMMNAGAIGDLARQMQSLVDKLKELGL